MTIDDITSDFEILDNWDDRYRYVIELGRKLAPLPPEAKTDANKVRGCASQVWITSRVVEGPAGARLMLAGESDSHIVQGLIAILLALTDGKGPAEIQATDIEGRFAALGLKDNLTPQRSNGFASMVARIRSDARRVLPT